MTQPIPPPRESDLAEWYDNNPVIQAMVAVAFERGVAEGRRRAAAELQGTARDDDEATGLCAACGRPVRQFKTGAILDPEPTEEGDVVVIDGHPVTVVREDVAGRFDLYRSHFHTCPNRLVETGR